jgi:hypothetical protein
MPPPRRRASAFAPLGGEELPILVATVMPSVPPFGVTLRRPNCVCSLAARNARFSRRLFQLGTFVQGLKTVPAAMLPTKESGVRGLGLWSIGVRHVGILSFAWKRTLSSISF